MHIQHHILLVMVQFPEHPVQKEFGESPDITPACDRDVFAPEGGDR